MTNNYIDRFKEYSTKQVVNLILKGVSNSSDENLIRMTYLAQKLTPAHQKEIETIRHLFETKASAYRLAKKVLTEIDAENPLDIMPKLKVMEEIVKQLKSKLNHNLMIEVSKYPENTFEYNGCLFTKTNRRNYDYSTSNKHTQLKSELKDLEKLMQTIKDAVADPDSGELIPPANYKESESVSIRLRD